MKKFAKLAAVFAALVLALSCFVACSNDDDDDIPSELQPTQGLWMSDDYPGEGMYIDGEYMYILDTASDGNLYLLDSYEYQGKTYNGKSKVSVHGNKYTLSYLKDPTNVDLGYETEFAGTFKIEGDKLTLTFDDDGKTETQTATKSNKKFKKLSEASEEIFKELSGIK